MVLVLAVFLLQNVHESAVGRMVTWHGNYRALINVPQPISTKVELPGHCWDEITAGSLGF